MVAWGGRRRWGWNMGGARGGEWVEEILVELSELLPLFSAVRAFIAVGFWSWWFVGRYAQGHMGRGVAKVTWRHPHDKCENEISEARTSATPPGDARVSAGGTCVSAEDAKLPTHGRRQSNLAAPVSAVDAE